jgi:hypothetical protein
VSARLLLSERCAKNRSSPEKHRWSLQQVHGPTMIYDESASGPPRFRSHACCKTAQQGCLAGRPNRMAGGGATETTRGRFVIKINFEFAKFQGSCSGYAGYCWYEPSGEIFLVTSRFSVLARKGVFLVTRCCGALSAESVQIQPA